MMGDLTLETKLRILEENQEPRQFTLEELAEFDGQEGRPAYVAVNGIVYDVTPKTSWAGGQHFGVIAGRDNSITYASCHAAFAILQRVEAVGILVE